VLRLSGLPAEASEADVRELCAAHGEVVGVQLGEQALVEFAAAESAQAMVDKCAGAEPDTVRQPPPG
jgi:hypothetical protein